MPILLAAAPAERPAILAIFAATYIAMAMGHVPGLKLNRAGIALLGAIAMMIFGGVSTADAVSAINWPTICLLFGFFVISAQLRLSGFYDRVAGGISARLGHPARFLLVLMAVTAGLSAVLNHDIVCYVFTPIVGAALLRSRINPVPFLIALAIASNLGAAATLIGNGQNMMIGEVAHLTFGRYLLWTPCPCWSPWLPATQSSGSCPPGISSAHRNWPEGAARPRRSQAPLRRPSTGRTPSKV